MHYSDIIKRQSVKVNNGSGILIKPLVDKCLYVFTANHVIKNVVDKNIKISLANDINESFEYDVIKSYRTDDTKDAAIIKIRTDYQVESLKFCDDFDKKDNIVHVGFPDSRRNQKNIKTDYIEYPINRFGQTVQNTWIEYEYGKFHPKSELDGCSGGAVIDDSYCLLGVHKGTVNFEGKECSGKAILIPISVFKKLIISNKEIISAFCYDLSSFANFTPKAFQISGKGMLRDLNILLSRIGLILMKIDSLSPEDMFRQLNAAKKSWGTKDIYEYKQETWVDIVEYLVGTHLITGINLNNGNICLMADKLRFVYADDNFEIEDAKVMIQPRLLGTINPDTIVVVGGLQPEDYHYDVKMPEYKIPDIAIAKVEKEGLDIASGGSRLMAYVTFVNNKLFADTMRHHAKEISQCPGDVLTYYTQLLNDMIYGKQDV